MPDDRHSNKGRSWTMKIRAVWMACLLAGTAAVHADDWPVRKAGLWEITMSHSNDKEPPMVQRICVDRETDAMMNRQAASMGPKCEKHDVHASAQKVTSSSVCDFGSSKLTSSVEMTYTGDTAFHADIQGHFDPPKAGMSDTRSTQDGHWVGACPSDMRPGDMIMKTRSGEMRMNMRDMLKH